LKKIIDKSLHYAGIGASAGGLEALRTFVANLPIDEGLTYIIAQHMSPDHPSMMVELLARETKVTIQSATSGLKPKPNNVYICPPNMDVTVNNGVLKLDTPSNAIGPKPSVNRFFTSLAEDLQERAIGIIFSGTGTDGAHGIKAIKASGGITIAQKPDEAKFQSMPNAAINIGGADLILSSSEIGPKLRSIISSPRDSLLEENKHSTSTLRNIIQKISTDLNLDFSQYKEATLSRQIARRMAAKQVVDIEAYDDLLSIEPNELKELASNFLICVTSFFRDPSAFEALREQIKQSLANKPSGSEFRVWVPACATGEEAYSIAIIVKEEIEASGKDYGLRIFATDVSQDSVKAARIGLYPESALSNVDQHTISKYFTIKDGMYLVNKFIQESVLFTKQNLVQDPPFMRLDMVSCRNVLIYFNVDLQDNILKLFHYCLSDDGLLFLGVSEAIGKHKNLYTEKDSKYRIFGKKTGSRSSYPSSNKSARISYSGRPSNIPLEKKSNRLLFQERLTELYAPASVLITADGDPLEIFGDCSQFLTIKAGKPNLSIYTLIKAEFRAEIRAYISRVARTNKSHMGSVITISKNGEAVEHRLAIHCLDEKETDSANKLLLITFQKVENIQQVNALSELALGDETRERYLEQELNLTRENLQTVIEELETSNEELQALNEEAQASNEEMQASNEELETTNEEMQASNEELLIVNAELNDRTEKLVESNTDIKNILNSVFQALIVIDNDLIIKHFNPVALHFFDIKPNATQNLALTKPKNEIPNFINHIHQVFDENRVIESEFTQKNGKQFLISIRPYHNNFDEINGAVITILDITKRKLIEEKLRLTASVFDTVSEATMITDKDNILISVNPAFTTITGYKESEVLGKNPSILSSGQQSEEFYKAMWGELVKEGSWHGEITNKRKNGELFNEWLSLSVLRNDEGEIIRHIAVFSDITETKKAQELIERQANFDSLTGLPNRNLTIDRLNQLLLFSSRGNHKFALMFLDLDNFKAINDTLGHEAGDDLLIQTAERLKEALRDMDTVGRMGGDEFIILIDQISDAQDAMKIANKLLENINKPYRLSGQMLQVSGSIGITIYPTDGGTSQILMKNADNAMYESKNRGRNVASFFTQEMQDKATQEYWLEQNLSSALKSKQIEFHYQPIIDLKTMTVVGAEALCRWPHHEKGFIPPCEFIPIAERSSLIHRLTYLAFETSLEVANKWDDKLSIAINLSLSQLCDTNHLETLISKIKNKLISNKSRIIIEITESVEFINNVRFFNSINKLKNIGCEIAIDDFGTGYSSLSYIKKLPIDIIKIDQTFVRDINSDANDRTMIKVILGMAREYGFETVAEGVETKEQLKFLVDNGCTKAQGYLFSKALPLKEFNKFVANFKK
jgi:two-component system, chemotaxis family, CheB/CheR fusion protein